ncbi:MAG: hypothetical protein AAF432_14760 [Planctomycetota bacterium]
MNRPRLAAMYLLVQAVAGVARCGTRWFDATGKLIWSNGSGRRTSHIERRCGAGGCD